MWRKTCDHSWEAEGDGWWVHVSAHGCACLEIDGAGELTDANIGVSVTGSGNDAVRALLARCRGWAPSGAANALEEFIKEEAE